MVRPIGVYCSPQETIDPDYALSLLGDFNGEEFKSIRGKRAVNKAIEYVESFGKTPYDFGRDLNYQGKTDKAIFWCEALAIATNDPSYFYGRAYYRWGSGDSEAAIRDVNFLVKKKLPPIITARTYYLRGRINLQNRMLGDAEKDFNQALESYKAIDGKYGGQYLCLTMLSRVAISLKEYHRVKPLLDAAIEADKKNAEFGNKPFGMSVIHEMYGAMYFEQRRFKEALVENTKSREAFLAGGRTQKAEGILVKIGLLEFINGNPKLAFEIASGIWGRLEDTSHTRLWAYNNVTLMMLALCSNQNGDYQVRKGEALAWAKADAGGQALIELVDFLENEIPCPKIQE